MITPLTELEAHWTPIAPIFLLRNEQEYDAAVERLNALLDEIGTNREHPLYNLLDTLGTLIHNYEERHHVIPAATGPEVLQFLMEEHDLSTADLPELGSSETVERYLKGLEELSVHQVRNLAGRFHVSPAAFIGPAA
jgi:HTH-type transcriptional regulator/antitoxin HigA